MFNLSFINPLFLFGALLVAAPIIIHLVNKKKAFSLKFPTIRFVVASNKRAAKRFKLRQLILLILRTLTVLFIVFLFARPLLSSKKNAMDYANLPRSSVVIIDNSFSMLYKTGGGDYFRSAVIAAKDIISGQKNIDNAALLTTSSITDEGPAQLTFKKDELLNSIRDVNISYTRSKPLKTIAAAVELLKSSQAQVKEIYFISDMQKFGWEAKSDFADGVKRAVKSKSINVYLIDIAGNKSVRNAGIMNLKALKQSKGKINVLNIFSRIKNFSKQAVDNLLVKCYIFDNEVVKGFVSLESYETAEKSLFAPIDESGIITGYVKIKGDSFAPDDKRYFSLKSYQTVRALVVDGEPTTQLYKSETFYLNLGLNPLKGASSKIESNIVTYDEYKKEDLNNYDVVFLCNVKGMAPQKVLELRNFVRAGGGLLFSLGDNVAPMDYNETFGDLLPQKLRDVFVVKPAGNKRPFEYIEVKDYSHPVIEPFEGAKGGDLGIAKFYKYFVLQPTPESKSDIILEYSNGNPCLV